MEKELWEILDHTGPKGGYLRLMREGQRVADFFPFARDADEQWIRDKAQLIATTMNKASEPAESI